MFYEVANPLKKHQPSLIEGLNLQAIMERICVVLNSKIFIGNIYLNDDKKFGLFKVWLTMVEGRFCELFQGSASENSFLVALSPVLVLP